jgi:hypothetical protein
MRRFRLLLLRRRPPQEVAAALAVARLVEMEAHTYLPMSLDTRSSLPLLLVPSGVGGLDSGKGLEEEEMEGRREGMSCRQEGSSFSATWLGSFLLLRLDCAWKQPVLPLLRATKRLLLRHPQRMESLVKFLVVVGVGKQVREELEEDRRKGWEEGHHRRLDPETSEMRTL